MTSSAVVNESVAAMVNLSIPKPPVIVSAPAPPVIVSAPEPVTMV